MEELLDQIELIKRDFYRGCGEDEEYSVILLSSYIDYLLSDFYIDKDILDTYIIKMNKELSYKRVNKKSFERYLKDIINICSEYEYYETSYNFYYILNNLII
jgi:hypothetical protein